MSRPVTRIHQERVDYLRCRTLGHAWFDYDSTWTSDLGLPLTLRCERCGTERRDTVGRTTGELITRHYTYPDGYSYAHGDEVPTRDDFRRMLLAQRVAEGRDRRRRRKVSE